MLLNKMKISFKLTLGFGIIVLILVLVGLFSINQIQTIAHITTEMYDHPLAVNNGVRDMRAHIIAVQAAMKDVALARNEEQLKKAVLEVAENEKEVFRHFDIVMERFLGDKKDVAAVHKIFTDWKPIRDEVIQLMKEGKLEEAALITHNKGARQVALLDEKIEFLADFAGNKADEFYKNALATEATTIRLMMFIIAIATIFSVFIAFQIAGSVIKPIKLLSEKILRVAGGDLTVETQQVESRDEMGMMTRAVNQMVVALRQQTLDISEGINILATSASEILVSVSQLSASSAETAAASQQTTTTVEEVKQTSEVSSQKAQLVSESSQASTQAVQKGLAYTQNSIKEMTRVREQMNIIAASAIQLSEQGQDIANIITTVSDLAEQSNLLAVNASIEAVKAGQHGKGFGVVALEIRRLAEQSKQSTIQIRTILNDIQKAVSRTVLATEQGERVASAGEIQSKQTGEVIQELTKNITDSTQAAIQIAASSQQQLIGITQVAEAMENIKQASTQNHDSALNLKESGQNLDSLGQRLKQLVANYKL
ncbi:MAG: methyl-accepting chemotaxis protein [SAR324 cluster bacterium]|nr:methyl-accepting chemotaxis protein [SAR324 cluster bacterium]